TGTHAPFFCVHGAGGNVLNFRDLADHMPKTRPIFGLQARGVAEGQRPHGTIEEMATEYVAAIREVQQSGPYLIGGYSGGGVIALEMARQLRLKNEEVAIVVLIDTFHPHIPPREGGSNVEKIRAHFHHTYTHGLR